MNAAMVEAGEVASGDRALVAAVRAGDRDAREALGRRVGPLAYVFALQLTGDRDQARDVAQDAVLRFLRALDRFDAERPIEPWLYQIVRNRVRDLGRRRGRRPIESLDALVEAGQAIDVDPADDPAVDVERAELQRRIWTAVSRLSEDHREIFVLRDHHGLSYRDIAEVLGIPHGTVMSRLHAARTNLRRLLATERPAEPRSDPGPDPYDERSDR